MTNREWLNTLTDEEFADWATYEDTYFIENGVINIYGIYPHRRNIENMCTSSYGGILDWLKRERIGFKINEDSNGSRT